MQWLTSASLAAVKGALFTAIKGALFTAIKGALFTAIKGALFTAIQGALLHLNTHHVAVNGINPPTRSSQHARPTTLVLTRSHSITLVPTRSCQHARANTLVPTRSRQHRPIVWADTLAQIPQVLPATAVIEVWNNRTLLSQALAKGHDALLALGWFVIIRLITSATNICSKSLFAVATFEHYCCCG
jgi:hypothetical protein